MNMTLELCKTVEIADVQFDVIIDFEANFVDNGFDHEFGTKHEWEWEIDAITDITLDGDLAASVRSHYEWSSVWLRSNRKRLHKAIKRKIAQVKRELTKVNLDSLASNDELIEACGDAPDYRSDQDDYRE
jgi:hypothetical protein